MQGLSRFPRLIGLTCTWAITKIQVRATVLLYVSVKADKHISRRLRSANNSIKPQSRLEKAFIRQEACRCISL